MNMKQTTSITKMFGEDFPTQPVLAAFSLKDNSNAAVTTLIVKSDNSEKFYQINEMNKECVSKGLNHFIA